MLQNEYLDAKIGVDTAENEPQKELCVVAESVAALLADGQSVSASRWPSDGNYPRTIKETQPDRSQGASNRNH